MTIKEENHMPTSGEIVKISGIYECNKCHNQVTCVKGEPFPPCCPGVNYKLVVETEHNSDKK